MENARCQHFTEVLWHAPLRVGRLALPSGGVPEPFVDLDDLAAVVARLLTEDGHAGRGSGPCRSAPPHVAFR